jgi:hypothetical protein
MKEDWEKEMEEFVGGMSEEEFQEFLKDTDYEFYTSDHFKKHSHIYPQWLQDLCKEHGISD